MFNVTVRIETDELNALQVAMKQLPDGTTADLLGGDLEAGNFEIAHIHLPNQSNVEIVYSGPVAEGYISPFDRPIEADL